ncbi:MAG: lytic transglycosylase domain-containing protein [Tabrizicola sp.]|nr:lytic transglycosylase domain-containing protein [Tabrizicola sp.]
MPRLRHRMTAGRPGAIWMPALALLSGLLSSATMPMIAVAEAVEVQRATAASFAAHITAASQRFRIPEGWIRAVIEVESAGQVRAVSSAGAIGLMQIMPVTWAELRKRHQLGRDPFDPRDNILAGTAYLREMYDRFGSPGFLAAYNAGPERYRQHVSDGRPLPRETRAYLAKLLPMMGLGQVDGRGSDAPAPKDWREAPIFVDRSDGSSTADQEQENRDTSGVLMAPQAHAPDALEASTGGIFGTRLREDDAP